jgi:hypothetical protein
LNFQYDTPRPLSPVKQRASVRTTSTHKLRRGEFTQITSQFLMLPGSLSADNLVNPDSVVDWDDVVCVNMLCDLDKDHSWRCAICLDTPTAARWAKSS